MSPSTTVIELDDHGKLDQMPFILLGDAIIDEMIDVLYVLQSDTECTLKSACRYLRFTKKTGNKIPKLIRCAWQQNINII